MIRTVTLSRHGSEDEEEERHLVKISEIAPSLRTALYDILSLSIPPKYFEVS